VSIAHNAIVHGCTIGNEVLIGMGAIVMDNAVVQDPRSAKRAIGQPNFTITLVEISSAL
jgi:acetyltransferase-like isoleucine patch superfamily enzyme